MTRDLADDLSWLRRRDDPRVLDFLHQENERTRTEMVEVADLEARLYEEIRSRVQETDRSVPTKIDDYFYFFRTEEGKPYRIWARARGSPGAEEEIYLDENELAEPYQFCRVGGHVVSPDHRYVAYAYDTTGDEDYVLAIKDIVSGEHLTERAERIAEDLAWSEDGKRLFYIARDRLKRSHRVYCHQLGFDPSEDALVYEEHDDAFHVELRKSRSRRFIFIETSSAVTRETLLVDAADPTRRPSSLAPRTNGVEYHAADAGDALLIRTNLDAINFRLLRAELREGPVVQPVADLEEVVPHREDVMLAGVEAFADYWVLVEREGGVAHLRVWPDKTGPGARVPVDEPVRALEVGESPEFSASRFRYVVSSPITPPTVYEIDPASGEVVLVKREQVPGFEPSRYRTDRIWATGDDGVEIPISLLLPKDLDRSRPHPCLLNGYGSYGVSFDPVFARHAISLVDRGFVYAIAHVRGGGELGERWHRQGKMLRKRHSFTDLIRCAETLIEDGYTTSEKLGIQGRSAGGLLVGAVTNMRPDLFGAVIAGVPFVDVLATMLDPTILLTVIEYEEWGDPRDPEYYDYIRSYSPFDNVRETDYPDILVTAGLNDPRVQYWEPARWVARLRERRTNDRLLLLKTDMGAGHLGPSDRFAGFRDKAFEYAFLIRAIAPDSVSA